MKDIEMPEGISELGQLAHAIILNLAQKHEIDYFGTQKSFWSPEEWRSRGELYGKNSELVVMYEDNDLRYLFDYDAGYPDYSLVEEMDEELASIGAFFECATGWYGSIYKISD